MDPDSSIAGRADLLARVDLFAGLSRLALAKLAAHLAPVALTRGDELFRQGDPGDAFSLIARGEVGVYVADSDGGESRVAVLGAGAPVGEMALLTSSPRSATIRAECDGEVLRLDRARFLKLVRQEPDVLLAIAATVTRRLQATLAGGAAAVDDVEEVETAAEKTGAAPAKKLRRRAPSRKTGGALVAALILVFGWHAAAPEGLSSSGWHALVLLAAAVPVLATDALPEGVLGLLLCAAWVIGGVARPEIALKGFASTSWILVVSV